MIPDPIVALRNYLRADSDVSLLAYDRVYAGSLPRGLTMPTATVVLSPGGGPGRYQNPPLMQQRVDVRCYGGPEGSGEKEAWDLHRVVRAALKALGRAVQGNCLLHSALMNANGTLLYEQEAWPYVFSSYMVVSAEVEVAA